MFQNEAKKKFGKLLLLLQANAVSSQVCRHKQKDDEQAKKTYFIYELPLLFIT